MVSSDELWERSLFLNSELESLCKTLDCTFVNCGDDLLELDNGFFHDGLHLNARGKAFFSYSLDLFLISRFERKKSSNHYIQAYTCLDSKRTKKALYSSVKKTTETPKESVEWNWFGFLHLQQKREIWEFAAPKEKEWKKQT